MRLEYMVDGYTHFTFEYEESEWARLKAYYEGMDYTEAETKKAFGCEQTLKYYNNNKKKTLAEYYGNRFAKKSGYSDIRLGDQINNGLVYSSNNERKETSLSESTFRSYWNLAPLRVIPDKSNKSRFYFEDVFTVAELRMLTSVFKEVLELILDTSLAGESKFYRAGSKMAGSV
jgi:hypothetical protein